MTQDESFFGGGGDAPLSWRELRHLLEAPRRRPFAVLVPWAAVVLLSVAALFVLPKKYKSSTMILVESEKMPESFVPQVVADDRSRHLQAIKPEILSRTRLEKVLEETNPYPNISSRTAAVETMRSATTVNLSGSDGFSVEFVHADPHKAQEVTNRIATLFIQETIKAREQQVGGAVDFLVAQVDDARKQLEKKDEALRRYKESRMGMLPEQLQTNLATMGMLQREQQTVEENLLFAREKQEALARGLEQSPGTGPGTPRGEAAELADLQSQLASLKARRYTDEHPDVESLRARIARLEARLARVSPSDAEATVDPSTLVTRGQLEKANLEVRNLEERRQSLERQIASLRANIAETPRTEQELATLTRDYEQLNENYTALLNKELEAKMAGRLEQRWKGDRFRMLDPANLPESPFFPNPSLILGLGALLGLIAGLGVSLVAEYLDPTVKDVEDLRGLQPYPVLACIPHHPGLEGRSPR